MSGDLWGPCLLCGEYWEDVGVPEKIDVCPEHLKEVPKTYASPADDPEAGILVTFKAWKNARDWALDQNRNWNLTWELLQEEKQKVLRWKEIADSKGSYPWDVVVAFNDRYFPDWRKTHPIYLGNAMGGENGERVDELLSMLLTSEALTARIGRLSDLVKKLHGGGTKAPLPSEEVRAKLLEESVDTWFYFVIFLGTLGYDYTDFIEGIALKAEKNAERMKNREGKSPAGGTP